VPGFSWVHSAGAAAAALAEAGGPDFRRSDVPAMYGTADEGIKEFLCRSAPGGDVIVVVARTSDGE